MRRKLAVIILILLLFLLLALFLRERQHADPLRLFGNVDIRQVDLGFRVAGRVTTLHFEEGDLVKPDSLVAVLDPQPYEDLVKQAAANVESNKAALANAERLLKRRKELVSDGGVSKEDLETTETSHQEAEANLKASEAALSVAKSNLQFTEIFAPIEGTILTRIREPGSVVNPADPVYTLSITSPVWVRAYIPEPLLGVVYPGMVANIYTDTKGGKVYQGKVGFISPIAEFTPKTVETTQLRTDLVYRIRIYVDNPDKGLRQGMPVTVQLQ